MENSKECKETSKTIIGIIVFVIFILSGIAMCFFNVNTCKEITISINVISIIFYISALLYCIIIIPIIFSVLNKKEKEKCYYFYFYLSLFFLPLGLVANFICSDNICNIIILLLSSLITAYCIYRKLRVSKEIDIQYLKYSQLLATVISTIIFSLGIYLCEKLEIIHMLFFSFPLLMLEIAYKKSEMYRERNTSDNQIT
jgi:hypothetical protein